jgi:transcriptional regulator with XRE-family HTH domain
MAEPAGTLKRSSPVLTRRWLGAELEQLRKDVGLTQRDAAKSLGWGLGKMGYIESGERPISVAELESKVLPLYAVPVEDRPRYIEMAEAANAKAWWEEYPDEDVPKQWKHYIGVEQGASSVRTFEFGVIPGLLQTEEYMTAVITQSGRVLRWAPESLGAIVGARLRRQQVLTGPDPLELSAVLDEAVLRRDVGDPAIMRDQFNHMADMAEQHDNITVRVVEFSAGMHAAAGGSFVILGFPRPDDPGMVFLESGPAGMRYLNARRDIYLYSRVFDHLVEAALDPAASVDMLRRVAGQYGG